MTARRPRVAVVHPVPVWHGGAEVVALWTIQALERDFDVTVVSYGSRPDFAQLDRQFGTSLAGSDIGWVSIPIPPLAFRWVGPFDILWRYVTMSYCRYLGERFDLFVSTFYEMDFGRPGVQYCHCPKYALAWSGAGPQRRFDVRAAVWGKYQRLAADLTGFELERVCRNVTLSNSEWTARPLAAAYGGPVRTIYPPVSPVPGALGWAEREEGFVCIGRLVPEKRFDAVIRIVERVRAQGSDAHLHLVVSSPEPEYQRQVEALAAARAPWVHLEWNLSREEVSRLCAAHKYGIHAREEEHFGLAPAEIAAAGAIVFVHDSGGQVEIAADRRLRYRSDADAAIKIGAVMRDESAQAELRTQLARRVAAFAPSHFMAAMRGVVSGSLEAFQTAAS